MIPLQQIQVNSPCHESWAAMDGDEQRRFCECCRKDVFNLSAMTSTEAQSVIDTHAGNLCVRYETQSDGSVRTTDSPSEPIQRKRRYAPAFGWAVALIVAGIIGMPHQALSAAQRDHTTTKQDKRVYLMGIVKETVIVPQTKPHTTKNPKTPQKPSTHTGHPTPPLPAT